MDKQEKKKLPVNLTIEIVKQPAPNDHWCEVTGVITYLLTETESCIQRLDTGLCLAREVADQIDAVEFFVSETFAIQETKHVYRDRGRVMDQTWFWQILQESKQESSGDNTALVYQVGKRLQGLQEVDDIKTFYRLYNAYLTRSYNIRVWQSLQEVVGRVSDDGFDYFRSWLLAQGEETFCAVIKHPEQVKNCVDPKKPWELEALDYIAVDVYEARTGRDLYKDLEPYLEKWPYPLTGYDWLQIEPPEPGFLRALGL